MKNKKNILGIIIFMLVIAVPIGFIGMNNLKQEKIYKEHIAKADVLIAEKKYDEAMETLQKGKEIKTTEEVTSKITLVEFYKNQARIFEDAVALIEQGKYDAAINELNRIEANSGISKEKIEEKTKFCKGEIVKEKSKAIEQLLSENKFDDAYAIINDKVSSTYISDSAIVLKSQIDKAKSNYEAGQEKLRIQEEEKKEKDAAPLSYNEASKLAIQIYFSKSGSNSKVSTWDEPTAKEIFEGMEGYMIQIFQSMPTHNATVAWYFVDINTKKVYSTLAGAPPFTLLN